MTDRRNFNGSLGRRTAVRDSMAGAAEGLFGDRCLLGGDMRFNLSLLRFLSFSLLLAFSGMAARSQSDRGTIAGTVLDSSGGVVANANVTATDSATGATYSATTGPTGGFRLYDLRVGVYGVSRPKSAPWWTRDRSRTCRWPSILRDRATCAPRNRSYS